ncbi:hypothetical protein [Bovine papular stomatitis virus]
MDEELITLLGFAMDSEMPLSHMNKLRRRLTKLRMNSFAVIMCLREAILRKAWLPSGSMLGTDITDDVRLLEFVVSEVDSARENIEPYLVTVQWTHNADIFDECMREAMEALFGDSVQRLAMGVVESRYPHLVAERCNSCLAALMPEDASVRFVNAILRYSGNMAGAIVDRSREAGSHEELADMVRQQHASKMRMWPRVVGAVVSGVVETDIEGLKAYCRTCLLAARFSAGGLLDVIKDHLAGIVVECIDSHVADRNLERALSLYIHFHSAIVREGLHAAVLTKLSGKTLYSAAVSAPPCDTDTLLSYIARLPKDELAGFIRVATARIVKSLYTEVGLEKHLSLKIAMERYPQMVSSSLNDLSRKYMAGTLRIPLLSPPSPMEHDGPAPAHDPTMTLVPVNVYMLPTTVPEAELTPPESLRGALERALERADTSYDLTPLSAFGRAEVTLTTSHGDLDVICSTAHLVCLVLMEEASRTGVTSEEVARFLGGDARLAEMALLGLCREKIAKRRTVDSVKRFFLNTRREVLDSPVLVFI